MAEYGKQDEQEKTTPPKGEEAKKILEKAKKRYEMCVKADSHNRNAATEDLQFINGKMWDDAEKQRRKLRNRPALQINLLTKYRNQVVNEIRQNKPKIKVRPVDSKADMNIAKIRGGLINNIEYLSHADIIYDQAAASVVECGYGAWRILTRFCEENPFEQEIYMQLLPNPLVAYLDPSAKDPTGCDAEYGFIVEKMSNEDFKDEYPKATAPGELDTKGQISNELWWDKETVTVLEYFVKKYEKVHKALMSDGEILDYEDAKKKVAGYEKLQKDTGSAIEYATIVKDKEVDECRVCWYKLTANEILEEKDWGGHYVPIVIVYGRERNIEGKRYIESMIRHAKDSQKLYNYWYTSAAEFIALAPKNPWLGSAKMFEGYEKDYAAANIDNVPFLKAKHDPNFPGLLPQRQQAPTPPASMFTALSESKKNIEDTLGMSSTDVMGVQGPERSGAAVRARQEPGDIGTFDFWDNLIRAVKHSGTIINDMLGVYYDTERDVRIRNVDGSQATVPINTTAGAALGKMSQQPGKYEGMDLLGLGKQMQEKGYGASYNDIKQGKYDVVVDTGPSYATRRMESADMLLRLVTAQPAIGNVAGDLLVKTMDMDIAEELSQRLEKTLPPGLKTPKPGEPPTPPMPPPPQVVMMMKKAETEGARQKVAIIKAQVELVKLYKEVKESETGIRQQILQMLGELHAPEHPADASMPKPPMMGMPGGNGGAQNAMPERVMQ